MCTTMTSGSVRVPFRVPGCDISSGRKTTNMPGNPLERIDPDHGRSLQDEVGLSQRAQAAFLIAVSKHDWKTQDESREGFLKLLETENVQYSHFVAACARLLDNSNNGTDGMEGKGFIMMICLLLGGQQSRKFLEEVRQIQPPAANTDDAQKIAFLLSGRELVVAR